MMHKTLVLQRNIWAINIVASDSDYIDAPEKTLFLSFLSPAGNKLRFGTVTEWHKLSRVYY
jgi:hypothetical protein